MKPLTVLIFCCGVLFCCVHEVKCMPSPDVFDDGEDMMEDEETESGHSDEAGRLPTFEHNSRLGAIVLKPSSFNRESREYFRWNWETPTVPNDVGEWDSEDMENDTTPVLKRMSRPLSNSTEEHNDAGVVVVEDDGEDDSIGGENEALDPEEFEFEPKIEEHGFSKILSINSALGVEAVTEGDMRFSMTRNAAGGTDLWPKSKTGSGLVPIPYKISNAYNKTEVGIIKSAMDLYTKHTCIRFEPRSKEIAYIYISDGKGCWAYVGKTGYSAQTVSLGRPGCVAKGIAAHELMHVVGFQHEHSRSDRDKYVTILEHNIQRDMRSNFEIYNNTNNLVIYDYNSVMHYSKNAFSKFQYLPAIQINPKRKPEPSIGQRERMSPYDIEEIKYLYSCGSNTYQRCGIDFLNRHSGQIKSPRYPNNYPPEAHCTWRITVPKGKYVSITFKKVDLEDSPLCQKDAILLHDGTNAAAPQLKTFCGTRSKPLTVTSTGASLFVMFTSDPSKSSFAGFEATFRSTSTRGVAPTPYTLPKLKPVSNPVNQFACDFEAATCSMSQDTLDELDWIKYKGKTPSHGTGPSADHTTGSGYYMYVESSLPSKVGDNAILRTPWLTRSEATCVQFSFHMLGSYMGTLRLYAFEKRKLDNYGHEVLLWERHGNQGNKWVTQSLTYRPTKAVERVQYYWEAFVFFYQSDIGLDDIIIKNVPCHASQPSTTTLPRVQVVTRVPSTSPRTVSKVRPSTTKSGTIATTAKSKPVTASTAYPTIHVLPRSESSCNFENGLCDWTQDTNDKFDWTRRKGGTPSHNTGPTTDHTTKDGYFLFIEASAPRVEGDVARLLSPPLTRKQHCFRIWYHMYGAQMGTLLISQITDGVEAKLIEKVGNKGDSWYFAEVDIITPSVKTSGKRVTQGSWQSASFTQIALDGIRGTGYPGDLAIDDIQITSSPCAIVPPTATPGLTRQISCDFDVMNDKCGFTDSDSDSFDWTQMNGTTPSKSTGPSNDHTKGDHSGYYMFIEASSPHARGDKAKLTSPKLESGSYCVRFYAHMWGSGMGSFKVYTLEHVDSENEFQRSRWQLTGSQGNDWFKAEFEFETAINIKYVQLEFEATIGPSFTSDIALDDVVVSPGRCGTSEIETTKQSSKELFSTRQPAATQNNSSFPVVLVVVPTPSATIKFWKSTTKKTADRRTLTIIPKSTKMVTSTSSGLSTHSSTKQTTHKLVKSTVMPTTKGYLTTATPKPTTLKLHVTTDMPTTKARSTTAASTSTDRMPASKAVKPTASRRLRPAVHKRPTTTAAKSVVRSTKTPAKIQPTTVISTTKIPDTPAAKKQFSCDFESGGLCDLTQSDSDNFDWILNSGNTPSSGTGPSFDHTYRTKRKGHYLFLEGSSPRAPGDKAVIVTPLLSTAPAERCVIFWYHMYGNGIGDLKVYSKYMPNNNQLRKKSDGFLKPKLEFEISENLGNEWRMAKFTVKRTQNAHAGLQLHFEGAIGKKFRSDIAIDDICITEGPCTKRQKCEVVRPRTNSSLPTMSTTASGSVRRLPQISTTSSPSTQTTKGSRPLNGLAVQMLPCTFDVPIKKTENSKKISPDTLTVAAKSGRSRDLGSFVDAVHDQDIMCGWEQEKTGDQFDWKRQSGATPSQFTGPKGDHSIGKGHYLFIESSVPRVFNDMAILKSRKMYPATYCVDLYYNMYGKGVGMLQVRSQEELGDGSRTVRYLKAIRGEQGEAWGRLRVTYKPKKNIKNVQFRIEGIRGKDYMGDIAIDDLEITPGGCGSCAKPNRQFTNQWRQKQKFFTGCITPDLFFVRCCSLADEKPVFRRVVNCMQSMYSASKLHLMCSYM